MDAGAAKTAADNRQTAVMTPHQTAGRGARTNRLRGVRDVFMDGSALRT
jgi:hypothetical protein